MTAQFEQLLHPPPQVAAASNLNGAVLQKEGRREGGKGGREGRRERRWQGVRERRKRKEEHSRTLFSLSPAIWGELRAMLRATLQFSLRKGGDPTVLLAFIPPTSGSQNLAPASLLLPLSLGWS